MLRLPVAWETHLREAEVQEGLVPADEEDGQLMKAGIDLVEVTDQLGVENACDIVGVKSDLESGLHMHERYSNVLSFS